MGQVFHLIRGRIHGQRMPVMVMFLTQQRLVLPGSRLEMNLASCLSLLSFQAHHLPTNTCAEPLLCLTTQPTPCGLVQLSVLMSSLTFQMCLLAARSSCTTMPQHHCQALMHVWTITPAILISRIRVVLQARWKALRRTHVRSCALMSALHLQLLH